MVREIVHLASAQRQLMALTDGSRQRTIASATQGTSGPRADIVDPSKMTPLGPSSWSILVVKIQRAPSPTTTNGAHKAGCA